MKTLSIKDLTEQGGFVGSPVKRTVSWKSFDGEEVSADVYVRKLNFYSAVQEIQAFSDDDGNSIASRIAGCICDEYGKNIFTPEIISGTGQFTGQGPLCGSLTIALLAVIGEVNKLGEAKPENSQIPTNSGMSLSSTESVEEQ